MMQIESIRQQARIQNQGRFHQQDWEEPQRDTKSNRPLQLIDETYEESIEEVNTRKYQQKPSYE